MHVRHAELPSSLPSFPANVSRGWAGREGEPGEDGMGRQVRRGRVLLRAKPDTHANMIREIESPCGGAASR